MQAVTWYPFPRTFNPQLCVIPNDGEAQYEAFQSIFAEIMSATYDDKTVKKTKVLRKKLVKPANPSPYELLCYKNNIELVPVEIGTVPDPTTHHPRFIFYDGSDITHYQAMVNRTVRNPYEKLQAYNTQGFCQMFAFFLATDNVTGFEEADQSRKIDVTNFKILANNTQACLRKTLSIMRSDQEVLARFAEFFNNIMSSEESRIKRGVKPGTTYDRYLNEFEAINEDLNYVKAYTYDIPLLGWKSLTPRPTLWFLPEVTGPTFKGNPPQFQVVGGKNNKRRKTRRNTRRR
jgi:hypothetical protein